MFDVCYVLIDMGSSLVSKESASKPLSGSMDGRWLFRYSRFPEDESVFTASVIDL